MEKITIEKTNNGYKSVLKISDFEIEQDIMCMYDRLREVNELILQTKEELYIKALLEENNKLKEENLNLREHIYTNKVKITGNKALEELMNMPTYDELKERVAYLERSISRKEEMIRNLQDELVETPKETELENRINNAIEHLKKDIEYCNSKGHDKNKCSLAHLNYMELLDILNGDNDPQEGKEKELLDKIEYLKGKIENKDMWCQLIADLGFDYDGYNDVKNLKLLIDELVKYALYSRDNYSYEDFLEENNESEQE